MLPWYKGGDVRSNPTKAMVDHILVVDDEPGSREGLRRLLQAWGYEADTASSGEEALARIEGVGPSAVITDLVMPGMDGLRVRSGACRPTTRCPSSSCRARARSSRRSRP